MMKRAIIAFLLVISLLCIHPAIADQNEFFNLVDTYLQYTTDFSRLSVLANLGYNGHDYNVCYISFDFREGMHVINATIDDQARLYAEFSNEELLSILYRMIAMFDEINAQVPDGYTLRYKIWVAEEDKIEISAEDISKEYNWIKTKQPFE